MVRYEENDHQVGVVVGVDGSAGADRALDWVLAKTDILGPITPLLTYRVEGLLDGMATPTLYTQLADAIGEAAGLRLTTALKDHPELMDRARIVNGVAGRSLVEAAASGSLLVVGSRGRSALAETFLGSVGSYCTKHASVPVAVITDLAGVKPSIDEIVVGIDGSPNCIAALEWALAHVSPSGRILAVACWLPAPLPETAGSISALEQDAKCNLGRALDAVETVGRGDPGEGGPTIETRVEYGDARRVLRDLGSEADLLVVGARGHRGVPYLLLGSVTSSLLHHPTTATVVVPEPTGQRDGGRSDREA